MYVEQYREVKVYVLLWLALGVVGFILIRRWWVSTKGDPPPEFTFEEWFYGVLGVFAGPLTIVVALVLLWRGRRK